MTCLKLIKAMVARGLFAIHAFVTVWRVVDTKGGNPSYWFLAAAILLLLFEGIVSVCSRQGEEMKWFCPSVFFYLLSIVPPIWVLELDMNHERHLLRRNATQDLANLHRVESLSNLLDLNINISLPREMWTKILEQILLVMLVIGRWLLPKGDLTREQLSQLLLVYTGMAADIVELFEAFKEDAVLENLELTYAVLGIWSWSLLQFTLVLTATHGRKPRLGMDSTPSVTHQESQESLESHLEENSVDMGIIAIVTSVVLQDGPFLLLRMVLIFRYNVVSYLNIFFTCKNSLVACLQLYRLSVLCIRRRPFKVCTLANEDQDDDFSEDSTNEESTQEESEAESRESGKKQQKKNEEPEEPDDDLWREFKEWKRSQATRTPIPAKSPGIFANPKNHETLNPENSVDLNDLFLRTAILARDRRFPDYLKYIDPVPSSKLTKNHSESDMSEYNSHEFYPFEGPKMDWNFKSVDSIVQDRPGSSISQQMNRANFGTVSTPTIQRRPRKHQPVKKAQDNESAVSSTRKNPRIPTKNLSCPPSSNDSGNSSTSVPDLRRALANNYLRRNYCASECFTNSPQHGGSKRKIRRNLTSEDEEERLRSESYV